VIVACLAGLVFATARRTVLHFPLHSYYSSTAKRPNLRFASNVELANKGVASSKFDDLLFPLQPRRL
jgi:hypothetical protein